MIILFPEGRDREKILLLCEDMTARPARAWRGETEVWKVGSRRTNGVEAQLSRALSEVGRLHDTFLPA